MAYGVSFGPSEKYKRRHICARVAPYDHWIDRGRPCGTVFKHAYNFGDDVIKWYFMPGERLAYIDVYVEFVVQYFRVYVQLSFDDATRTMTVERLFCERKNYWNDLTDFIDFNDLSTPIKSGSGGAAYYFKNVDNLGDDFVSLIASKFFGDGWKVNMTSVASAATTYGKDQLMASTHLAKDVGGPDDYLYGPWGMTVGVYQG